MQYFECVIVETAVQQNKLRGKSLNSKHLLFTLVALGEKHSTIAFLSPPQCIEVHTMTLKLSCLPSRLILLSIMKALNTDHLKAPTCEKSNAEFIILLEIYFNFSSSNSFTASTRSPPFHSSVGWPLLPPHVSLSAVCIVSSLR